MIWAPNRCPEKDICFSRKIFGLSAIVIVPWCWAALFAPFFSVFFRGKGHSWSKVTCPRLSFDPITALACAMFAIQLHFIVLSSTNHEASRYSVVVVKMQNSSYFWDLVEKLEKNFSLRPTHHVVVVLQFVVFWAFFLNHCWCENMPESTIDSREVLESVEAGGRRKKARFPNQWSSATTPHQRTLELEGVIEVLREYDSIEGNDINCSICGKHIFFPLCFYCCFFEAVNGVNRTFAAAK